MIKNQLAFIHTKARTDAISDELYLRAFLHDRASPDTDRVNRLESLRDLYRELSLSADVPYNLLLEMAHFGDATVLENILQNCNDIPMDIFEMLAEGIPNIEDFQDNLTAEQLAYLNADF